MLLVTYYLKSLSALEKENADLKSRLAKCQQELESTRQSEFRYRQIFENSPISMVLINTDGHLTQMNAAAQQLYGLPLEQFDQQACPIFENPQLVENGTLPYMKQAFSGVAVIEPPTCYDTSRDSAGGRFHYGRGHYAPIRNEAGVVEEIVEVAADFNDFFALQKQLLQEQYLATKERSNLLFTVSRIANLLLLSSDYKTVLDDVLRLLGEAVGSDRCAIINTKKYPVSPDANVNIASEWCKKGILSSEECTPELEKMVLQDFPELYEKLVNAENANYFIQDLSESSRNVFTAQGVSSIVYLPIIVNNQPWGQIGFDNCGKPKLFDQAAIAILKIAADNIAAAIERQMRDEQLRASETRYRTLFELSNEGIYRFTIEPPLDTSVSIEEQMEWLYQAYRIAEVNHTFASQYGFSTPEEAIGKDSSFFCALHSEKNCQTSRDVLENCYQLRNRENQEITADGKPRYFLQNIVCDLQNGYVVGGWGSQLDITELRQTQEALAEERIRVETALIRQRNSIAQDIHDTLAQSFGGILMQLQAATYFASSNPEKSTTHLITARDLAKEGLSQARKSVWSLHEESGEYRDLNTSIAQVVRQLTASSDIEVNVEIEGDSYLLDPDLGMNLLRIFQEAVTNVVRHSQASTLSLRLIYEPQQIHLQIRDNGHGFDPTLPIKGFGLTGMQQRCDSLGADFRLNSKPGSGTLIQVTCSIASGIE